MNRIGVVCFFLGAVLAAPGQEPSAAEDTPTFQSSVRLVQVPVVVRDKDGRSVSGLHKEDFELFDRGKRREIAYLAETKPGGQIAADRSQAGGAGMVIPERFIAFVFDDVGIREPADLAQIRDAATRQMETLKPSDRAAVLTSSCRVLLDFTDDRAKLKETVARMAFRPVPVCRVGPAQVLQLTVMEQLIRRMALLPGQRSIVLISPGFYVGHDRTAEEAELIELAIRSRVLIDALDGRFGFGSQPG